MSERKKTFTLLFGGYTMENENVPPAKMSCKTKGIRRPEVFHEQEEFTDANRKKKESDDHTVGGF